MRKAGFAATLVAGVGLLGVSLHGMTGVDRTLAIAAATPAPTAPSQDLVLERSKLDCDRYERPHRDRGGRV
ncbi:hypothetical protein DVA67_028015 [Solirubrobacter sp. CPCC 204708]|uniref:Uncharacterized protein n=1 Tax=Solirubrobacter deserti TaxID=2282478 RepID=A0ABT4RJG8_9ACTN|nr:hypothetical protein [Solirubrobacter deserti]MBE2319843.1 hypothetical protein [Solirubrobacter deserti]MDA0138676.1 hypothetical protein [Solirubrobacter deserti]